MTTSVETWAETAQELKEFPIGIEQMTDLAFGEAVTLTAADGETVTIDGETVSTSQLAVLGEQGQLCLHKQAVKLVYED